MASYTIEIPDGLHHEIQERRHQIDVADICTQALSAWVHMSATSLWCRRSWISWCNTSGISMV